MTEADMAQVEQAYVQSAKYAEQAGFDMLEVHMAHGYLLASFLSPLTNVRTDAYGGSLEARMRFPLRVFDAVRAAWPKARPMSVRLSATDWYPGGLTGEDSVHIARVLKEHGCDLIDVSTGQTIPEGRPPFYGRMYQTPFADQIRNDVGMPTMAVGNITSADQANTILAAGRADLIALARGHLRDPYFTYHAAEEAGVSALPWPHPYGLVAPRPQL
jgi:anthraniloyl-CoA monooxygenase